MKSIQWILSAGLIMGTCGSLLAADEVRERMALAMRQHAAHLRDLRAAIGDYYEASESGDEAAARVAQIRVRSLWNDLPPQLKNNLENRHPGTNERVTTLISETTVNGHTATAESTITRDGDSMHRDTTITGENGKTVTQSADVQRDGNTVTREGQTTGPNGETVTRSDTWTKDGDTTTHEGTVTGPNGQTATIEGQTTRTEDGFHRESTVTGPDGKTAEKEVDVTRDGDTVTREAQVTGPNGKTVENTDTWTRDGNTVTHEGQTTGADGEVKQTRESTATRDGNTVTRDAHRENANGSTADAHGTRTRDGNTVTGSNEVTRTPGARRSTNYADDSDLFGDRPNKTQARNSRPNNDGGNTERNRPTRNAGGGAGAGGRRGNR